MTNVVDFVQEVGNEFLHRFPIFFFNFAAETAKHVWRDGEMFRRHGVVAMEVVKFWRDIRDHIPLCTPCRRGCEFSWRQSRQFPVGKESGNFPRAMTGSWLSHTNYYSQHMTVRKGVLRGRTPPRVGCWLGHIDVRWSQSLPHAVFDHEIHVSVSYEVQFGIRIF